MLKTTTLVLLFLLSSDAHSQAKQQELGFLAQLQAQEDEAHTALIKRIQSMSDAEYSAYLNSRITETFIDESGPLPAVILVDVTEEINEAGSSILQFLFSFMNDDDDEKIGENKIAKVVGTQQNTVAEGILYKSSIKGEDRKLYQKLEGRLNQKSAYLVASQNYVKDIHFIDSDSGTSTFLTIHTPTGRVVPQKKQKIYDSKFIDDGLYTELLEKFEDRDTLVVQVSFEEPQNYKNTKMQNDDALARANLFLESWSDYDFEVMRVSSFYILMQTTKEHVLAMKADSRVKSISQGSFL